MAIIRYVRDVLLRGRGSALRLATERKLPEVKRERAVNCGVSLMKGRKES